MEIERYIPILCEAFGLNTQVHSEVDRVHKTKEEDFTGCRVGVKIPLLERFARGTIRTEVYARKMLGIFLYLEKTDDSAVLEDVFKIVKRGWPGAYRFISKRKHIHIREYFTLELLKRQYGIDISASRVEDELLECRNLILQQEKMQRFNALTNINKPIIEKNTWRASRDAMMGNVSNLVRVTGRFSYEFFVNLSVFFWLANKKGGILVEDDLIDLFYRFVTIETNPTEIYSYRNFDNDTKEFATKALQGISKATGPLKTYRDFELCANEMVCTDFELATNLLESENLHYYHLLRGTTFTKGDMQEILGICSMGFGEYEEEFDVIFAYCWGFVLKGLAKAYNALKKEYTLTKSQDADIVRKQEKVIIKLKEGNTKLREQLTLAKKQAHANLPKSELSKKRYANRISKLKKEVADLNRQLELERLKNEELKALRELMFSLNTEQDYSTKISKQKGVNLVKVKGVVFGGHSNWRRKMRDSLPGFAFIISENFDPNVLDNAEIALFNPRYMSHALYYKAINEIRKRNIRIGYLDFTNEEKVLKEIERLIVA